MECIDIGSKIVTIAIMLHGSVISLNLPPANQNMLDNTRLFSLSGDFTYAYGHNSLRLNNLEHLYKIFRHDLPVSTHQIMEEFTERVRLKYANYIDFLQYFLNDLTTENICKVYQTITIDKAFGTNIDGIYATIMNCILPDVLGIYVVSVHEKTNTNQIELVYPLGESTDNLNLLVPAEFIKFANIFGINGKVILERVIEESSTQPKYSTRTDDETFKTQLNDWKVTCSSRGDISGIRLSYLIKLIKQIVGKDKCKLNIFDYSCSVISQHVSNTERKYAEYHKESDIESGTDKSWGGTIIHKNQHTHPKKTKGGFFGIFKPSQEKLNKRLKYAVVDGSINRVRKAIEAGALINAYPNIIYAVSGTNRNIQLIRLLIENGANVNIKDEDRKTPLMVAAFYNNPEVVRLLIDNGADVNVKDYTDKYPLTHAVYSHPIELVHSMQRPFGLTEQQNTREIIHMLVDNGADVNLLDKRTRQYVNKVIRAKPKCMTEEEYAKCEKKEGDDKPTDPISLEQIERKDAIKLQDATNVCYHRNSLNKWFEQNNINPLTREPIDADWIDTNMGECEDTIGSTSSSARGGKRKRQYVKTNKNKKGLQKKTTRKRK